MIDGGGSANSPTGAESLVDFLINKGVELVFSVSGAGNLAILDAIVRDNRIRIVYSHHEQAAAMEAQGYSRVSGKAGVVILTTGGGAANGITGILSAHMDSVPLLVITGNESSFHIDSYKGMRAIGVQGFDSIQVLSPISKVSYRVKEADDLVNRLEELWTIMFKGRPGPIHVDFPMDLQRKNVPIYDSLPTPYIPAVDFEHPISEIKILEFLEDLKLSKRPLLYIGNGCRNELTMTLLRKFVNENQIPYILSWSAIDLFPNSDPLNVGRVGIYGDRAANVILQKCDLLLAIGTRLAIPQVGYDKKDFARLANKWVIEIDATECQKFPTENWNVINSSAHNFLSSVVFKQGVSSIRVQDDDWKITIADIWKALPRYEQARFSQKDESGYVHSVDVIDFLNKCVRPDAILVTDVGAGLLSGHYMLQPETQRVITSQGLGEMGFGLPGAIGAYFASPGSQIICLNTDGGIMFNLQELQLIHHYRIPIKLFVFNNLGYAMIKASQDNLFSSRYTGSGLTSGISFPEFRLIADAFNLGYFEIQNVEELNGELVQVLNNEEATLIEVRMSPNQKYLPRLGTRKSQDGSLISPPLEDMDPLISLETLSQLLGYAPSEASVKARKEL